MKYEYIVKFEFKTLFVQFRNTPVCSRKVCLSESDEVTISDALFAFEQYGNVEVMNARRSKMLRI